mgnify:CR=1 FL=1
MSEWDKPGRWQPAGTCFREGSGVAGRTARPRRAPGAAQLPLLAICQKALGAARARPDLRQVLIVGGPPGQKMPRLRGGAQLALHRVSLGAGERIGHPDLLLALSMGFTHVLWQQEGSQAASVIQRQERQVCEYLGGQGRISLFSGAKNLRAALADLAFLPLENAPVPAAAPPVRSTRRDTARACASFLLRRAEQQVPLPECAPYGQVRIDSTACSGCQSCVWMCPTGALSLSEDQTALAFTESACIQCGMCRAACPQSAIELEARLNLDTAAEHPRPALDADAWPCRACGAPVAPRSMVDRILDRLCSGHFVAATPEVAEMIPLCPDCRDSAAPGPAAAAAGALDS